MERKKFLKSILGIIPGAMLGGKIINDHQAIVNDLQAKKEINFISNQKIDRLQTSSGFVYIRDTPTCSG